MPEESPAAALPEGGEQKKLGRCRPKDEHAPPKPKSPFQRIAEQERKRIKETTPTLASDLKAMAAALKEAWDKVPQGEKERLQQDFDKEMEAWRPKWAAYKETDNYKRFFELRQDYVDLKTKKKLIKGHVRGKMEEGSMVRVATNFEHAYPEGQESNNYKLKMGQKGTVVASNVEGIGNCEIQWEDGKKEFLKKYFGKLEDPDIPKRPKSGYMIFAGEVREQAQKEVEAAGGGMGDVGKKISDWWNESSEAKKSEYQEMSSRMKEQFDKEYRVYKMSNKFKGFENKKVNLQSIQKLKKLQRTTLNEAPKRALSAFSLWKRETQPKLMEEQKQAGMSMNVSELSKKLGEMWAALPEADKKQYVKQSAELKLVWESQHVNFKKHGKYMKFLEERQKLKIRQNRLLNLRDLPRKPKSVFALFAAAHKSQGKSEGKGSSALKQQFAAATEEEKAKLAQQAKEAEDMWIQEVDEFKAGEQFKTYAQTEEKVKKEFMTEAIKVMTVKFINAAPAAPPKSPFAVFLGEKRKAEGQGEDAPKSKEARQEEVVNYKAMFDKLDKDTQQEFENKRKQMAEKWKEEVKAFMAKETWQDYLKEARRLKIPVQQLLVDKKQVKKFKNGMRFIPLPDKPETIPQKPPNAQKLFIKEKRKEVDSPEKIIAMWKELDDEGKKKYEDRATDLQQRFERDMQAFRSSEDGKAYFRKTAGALRSRRIIHAKFAYLKDMPKQPEGALKTYLDKNFKKELAANPKEKAFDVRKKLTDRWLAMSPEERGPLEAEAKEKYDKYLEALEAFKTGDKFKKYSKAVKGKAGAKTKNKAKAKRVGKGNRLALTSPKPPAAMPRKPRTALQEFSRQEGNAGMTPDTLQAAFAELPEERKKELETRAKEAEEKYEAALLEFNKSEEGMMYKDLVIAFEKKKKLSTMKAKLANAASTMPSKPEGMPEKPRNTFRLFCNTQRGSGKDLGGLHKAFKELDMTRVAELEANVKELEDKYVKDLAAFEKSDAGREYTKAMAVFQKRKSLGEAKAKFLGDMPKKPDTAFKFFANDMRDQVAREHGLKGLGAISKLQELFNSVPEEGKIVYKAKEKVATEEYERQMKEFQKSDAFKKYKKVETKVSGKKDPANAKAKVKASGLPPPVPPADMPKKPAVAFSLFRMEYRGSAKEVQQKWLDLKAEGQEEWNKKYNQKVLEYEKAVKEFNKTADGKKYYRLKAAYDKKQAEKKAKERYLGGGDAPKEPKRPASAYFLFMNSKREALTKELGTTTFSEMSSRLPKMWQEASSEEREMFENRASEAKKEYEKAMAEYKSSAAVQKYDKAVTALKKPKAKAKGRVVQGGPAASGRVSGATKGRGKGPGAVPAKPVASDSDVMGSDSSDGDSSSSAGDSD